MKGYSTYQKELDPFNKEFDPVRALGEFEIEGPSTSSIDAFEEELLQNEEAKELVNKLKEIESKSEVKQHSDNVRPVLSDRRRRDMIKKRVKQTESDEFLERTGIEYFDGIGFALAHGGPYECLRKWVKEQTRVTIKLQASSPEMQPNRCLQAAIIAYDKHWNLIVRDCDEVYQPAKRLGHVQTYKSAIPAFQAYVQVKNSNILSRYSKCTMIMGQTIVCIYDERAS